MRKPNVLLINLPYVVDDITSSRPKLRSFLAMPYGLLSVATYCKDLANIFIIDCDAERNYRDHIKNALSLLDPDIVGFSMMFDNSYPHLEELAKMVKRFNPRILVVLGGAAAAYSCGEIIREQENVDAICYGEGEAPFRNLLESFETPEETGFLTSFTSPWVTQGSPFCLSPLLIPDLDDVIGIDYSFIDPLRYDMQEAFSPFARPKSKQFFLMTSRGCPYACTFCSNAALHGKQVRYASVGKIIEHVQDLVDEGMETLTIYDDQLLSNTSRAKELFRRLAPFKLRVEMPNGLSVRFIDAEMAMLMRAAGVDTVYLAIESGSEYVLRELIRKPLKLEQVAPAVKELRQNDFFIHGFFVVGMPGETDEMRDETVRFINEVGLDWAGFNPATPVRGSQLYDDCIRNGWIKKAGIGEMEDKKYIIEVPGTPAYHVEKKIDEMNIGVNFHNNYRMKIGDYETASRCFEQVLQRYKGHYWANFYLKKCQNEILLKGGK